MVAKRIVYFDLLKVISAFAVVFIHVISEFWYDLDINSSYFIILTVIDSLLRFAVPIYLMISGALFLNHEKEISLKVLFKKYILKIFLIYVTWNMIYTLGSDIILNNTEFTLSYFINSLINTILGNNVYHLYFLVLIIGFYLSVPVLKILTKKENKKIILYLLSLLFVFTSLFPLLFKFLNFNLGYEIMFGGYLLYVILGYYLHNFDFSKKTLNIIYIFGFLSLLLTIILTIYHSIYLGVNSEVFFNYLSPNVMIMSMCVFLIFKNIKNCSNSFSKVLSFFSKYYFGIYLIHGLVMGLFIKFGLFSLNVYLPLLCLILSVLVFITSLLISFLMSKVPFVKWFVSIR